MTNYKIEHWTDVSEGITYWMLSGSRNVIKSFSSDDGGEIRYDTTSIYREPPDLLIQDEDYAE